MPVLLVIDSQIGRLARPSLCRPGLDPRSVGPARSDLNVGLDPPTAQA